MKYLANVPIDFMDGQKAKPGDVVDLDPAKVTDIEDLEHTIINMAPALVKVDEPAPAPQAYGKRGRQQESEVTADDQ